MAEESSCKRAAANSSSNVTNCSSRISELREAFLDKYGENIDKGMYDDRDLDRVKSDDKYVGLFAKHTLKSKLDDAVGVIHESLKWRMEFQVNDLTESSFDRRIWEQGAVFFHNQDKDGHKILFIRVKEHKRDAQLLPIIKKFFAFHLEKTFQKAPNEPVVVLFDMVDTGMNNLDMELIKFVIMCFKYYYPCLLATMLVYEMSWIFNAAWKIVKTWLSYDAVQKIKFVNRSNIQEYISKGQLLEHMGGTDKFQYSHTPSSTPEEEETRSPGGALSKRVKFSDNTMFKSFSSDSIKDAGNGCTSFQSKLPGAMGLLDKKHNSKDNWFRSRLLSISPAEELCFYHDENVKETSSTISLTNSLPYPIAYKVKTTSPEKFRVRPSGGLVMPGSAVAVNVHVQTGFENRINSDKFLVRAMEITDESRDVSELWKTVPRDSIMEHRLRCLTNFDPPKTKPLNELAKLTEKVEEISETNQRIEKRQQQIICLQLIFLFVVLMAIAADYLQSSSYHSDPQRPLQCSAYKR